MSVPFVSTLRSRRDAVRTAAEGVPTLSIRVQMSDLWDVVRLECAPHDSVLTVKRAVLDVLQPNADPDLYVMKLGGFEVLDETLGVEDAGATNGSTFVLMHRRRRPVR